MKSVYPLFDILHVPEDKFQTIPELVRWAKKNGLMDKEKRENIPDLKEGEYKVRLKSPSVKSRLNIKTGRMKKFKTSHYLVTKIKPEDRTFKNIPRYYDRSYKVRYQDWLQIKTEKDGAYGKSSNGRWYGWSHRAVSSFGIGDKIKSTTVGNFKKKEWIIKTEDESKQMAKQFASEVS